LPIIKRQQGIIMNIKEENYSIIWEKENQTITFDGTIRLQDLNAYKPIKDLLILAENETNQKMIMNLKSLKFLNSSGITTISMFIINARKAKKIQLTIIGSKEVSWQGKTLANFKKIWKDVELEIT